MHGWCDSSSVDNGQGGVVSKDIHGAGMPVGIAGWMINIHTEEGDGVFDPFAGSGTTLIAAEQLDRTCYAMDIEPRYVDVVLERWERFTGEKAVKL